MSSKLVRQAKRVLIGGVMVSMGLGILPVQAQQQPSDAQVAALVEALRLAAPKGDNANEGLTSDWAIKPDNIPRWSRLCTGQEMTPAAFSANPTKAREILGCVMRDVMRDEYSGGNESSMVQRSACWWMTGNPNQCTSGATRDYVQKVLGFYQKQGGNTQSQAPATPAKKPASQPSAQSSARSSSSSSVSDAQVGALVEALRKAAQQRVPGNNGLVSEWQILPENIGRWSKGCTGQAMTPAQFEANTTKAREILVCVMRDVMRDEYKASGSNETVAVQRAASWWLTGDPGQYNSGAAASFSKNVLSFYQQQRSSSSTQTSTIASKQTPLEPSAQPSAPEIQPTPQAQPSAPESQPTPQSSTQPPALPASPSQISDAQVGAFVEALRQAALQANNPNNGLYGDWQVKAENIPRWSKQCHGQELTPTQFQSSPVTARAILVCVMRDVLREQFTASSNNEPKAVKRAAAWWMTGDPNQYDSGSTATYAQTVFDLYQESRLKFFSHI